MYVNKAAVFPHNSTGEWVLLESMKMIFSVSPPVHQSSPVIADGLTPSSHIPSSTIKYSTDSNKKLGTCMRVGLVLAGTNHSSWQLSVHFRQLQSTSWQSTASIKVPSSHAAVAAATSNNQVSNPISPHHVLHFSLCNIKHTHAQANLLPDHSKLFTCWQSCSPMIS